MIGSEEHDGEGVGAGERWSAIAQLEIALTAFARRAGLATTRRRLLSMADSSLDPAEYSTLARIDALGPARLSELAESLGVDASTASRQVNALVKSGLARRTVDPTDRRASLLAMTARGFKALEDVREARRHALAGMVDAWTSQELAVLASLLDRLVRELASAEPADEGRP